MRYNEFNISDPVKELEKRLIRIGRGPLDINVIKRLVNRISSRHQIPRETLHGLFVKKHGHSPDAWIKKIKQRNEQVHEDGQVTVFIVSVDGKPVVKFQTQQEANQTASELQKKFPAKKVVVKPTTTGKSMYEGDVVQLKRKPNQVQYGKRTFPPTQRNVDKPEGNITPIKKKNTVTGPSIHSIYEEQDPTINEINKFIDWTKQTLNITGNPEFTFSKDTDKAQEGHHTGVHSGNQIWVYIGNRNLIDILRTVFHELVHQRQEELNMIEPGDSYPGSPIEAMADMLAGKYIKIYGKEHPEIFQ